MLLSTVLRRSVVVVKYVWLSTILRCSGKARCCRCRIYVVVVVAKRKAGSEQHHGKEGMTDDCNQSARRQPRFNDN
jgi:hypothetical protein